MRPADAPGRWSRRRARHLLLRTRRVFRHHYGSLITLAVLSVVLSVALTSSSFSSGADERSAEQASPPASRIQLPDGFRRDLAPPPADPRVTYYLYEDEEQRKLLTDILRRDFTNMTRMGLPNYIGEVYFLRVSTDLSDDYLSFLLSEVVALAKADGLTVNIVDLR